MKALITALTLVLATSVSFADHHEGTGHTKEAPAAGPASPNTGAPSEVSPGGPAGGAKMTKKEAKAACKTEGKKGKDLKQCIKEKTQ